MNTVWFKESADLVMSLNTEKFASQLDDRLRDVADFDLSCIFRYWGQNRPKLLHDGLHNVSPPVVMDNYLGGTYLLDAVYTACRRRTPAGLYRLADLAPDAFFEGDYFNSPDVHPCISMQSGALSEEIVFLGADTGGTYLAYSLLRQNGRPAFSDSEFSALQEIAPMVIALIVQQWKEQFAHPSHPRESYSEVAAIEHAFASFAANRLTTREQTVISLILRGHSSGSIGHNLQIAEGTVKIHRKNIYSKLGISSQNELFNLFLQHVLSTR